MQYGLVGNDSAVIIDRYSIRDSQSIVIFSVICLVARGCCLMDSHRHFLCALFSITDVLVSAATPYKLLLECSSSAAQYQYHREHRSVTAATSSVTLIVDAMQLDVMYIILCWHFPVSMHCFWTPQTQM